MAVFISAGHNPKGVKKDPGAVSKFGIEAELTIDFRNLVIEELNKLDVKFIQDRDDETLGQYLSRIQPGNASVVVEFHFDAALSESATGCTSIYPADCDKNDIAFSRELVDATSRILGLKNRGAHDETKTARGRLGLMRKQGTVSLLELAFVSNPKDVEAYHAHKRELAKEVAKIIKKYEDLIQ